MVLAQYPKDHPVWRDLTFCSEELHNIVQEGPHVVTAAPPQAPPTRNSAATEMKMPPKELLIPPKVSPRTKVEERKRRNERLDAWSLPIQRRKKRTGRWLT